jgi:FkbM family methyltransferase
MLSALISFLMRSYRKSRFYPQLGKRLARVLSLVTRLRGKSQVVQEIDGVTFELNLQEVIDASLYYSGTFEAEAEEVLEKLVRPGMVAVDIGANFGYHTFRMARSVGAEGRVLAVEPTTWAYDKLQRNAALNPAITNIDYVKVGLSDSDVGETAIAFQSSYRLDDRQENVVETVRLTTLDIVIREQQLPRVDFIKMDVDGFEGRVLRGGEQTLREHHPVIFFELSPSAMRSNDDDAVVLLHWLEEVGYDFRSETQEAISDVTAFCATIAEGYSVNLLAVPSVRVNSTAG